MTRTRRLSVVLAAIVFTGAALVLFHAYSVGAEATHSGTFSTGATGQIIYTAVPPSPAAVMLTVCQTSGTAPVQVLIDGTSVVNIAGCKTLALTVAQSIQVTSASATAGTYSISLDLAGGAPR